MKSLIGAVFVVALALTPMIGVSAAPAFLQASSTDEQLAPDAKPHVVSMNSTDASQGITNKGGVVTVTEAGPYFLIAAAQVGGTAKGQVRLWMRVNGTDVDNSNTIQAINDPSFTAVLVCQGVAELKAGDKVEVVYSATAPGLGLIVRKPEGEPVVPSVIFTGFKLN